MVKFVKRNYQPENAFLQIIAINCCLLKLNSIIMNSQSVSKKIVTEDKNFLSLESVEKQNF